MLNRPIPEFVPVFKVRADNRHAKHTYNDSSFVDLELILMHCIDSKLQQGCPKCIKKGLGY